MSEINKIPILCRYFPELQQNLPWKPLGQFPTPIRKLDGLNDYFGGGYGCPTEAGRRACERVKNKADVILDLTYTAKTFAAVMGYCQIHTSKSEPVLYWHTYNSVDLSAQANPADVNGLPQSLQKIYSVKGEA